MLCASLLLTATLVPRSCLAAEFPGNSRKRWDARGPYNFGSESGTPTSCSVKLRPSGQCGSSGAGAEEGEDCPYQLTLPPLTIQLPRQFRMLEKAMKELQELKEVVDNLKRGCQECRGAQGNEALRRPQADRGQTQEPIQGDAWKGERPELTAQGVKAGLKETRGDGMVIGGNVDGTRQGQGSISGKITQASPSNMQEMQVRQKVQSH